MEEHKNTNDQPKHPSELFTLMSILFGIIGLILSFFVLRANIISKPGKVEIILAEETGYVKGSNGERDTLFINTKQDYFEFFKKDTAILILKITDSLDLSDKFKSKYIDDYVFAYAANTDPKSYNLKDALNSLDSKYEDLELKKRYFFNQNPKILVWVILISIAIGFSFYLVPVFIGGIKKYTKDLQKQTIWINCLGAVLILLLLFLPQLFEKCIGGSMLTYPKDIQPVLEFGITPFGFNYNFAGTFLCVIFWLVLILSMSSTISHQLKTNTEALSRNILDYQADFENYLIIVAIYLAYIIVCNNTVVDAMNNLLHSNTQNPFFPTEFSFINGLMQTFILLVIYLAVSANFSFAKTELSRLSQGAEKSLIKKKSLNEYLKIIFAILAPVLGSGIQEIIKVVLG